MNLKNRNKKNIDKQKEYKLEHKEYFSNQQPAQDNSDLANVYAESTNEHEAN